MSLHITGFLYLIGDEQQVSNRFRKREFVLHDVSTQYPQFITFQCTQDRCGLLDDAIVGTEITVYFNLKGREWNSPQGETKYFNTLEAWKIEKKFNYADGNQQRPGPINPPDNNNITSFTSGESDDLPF